MFSNSNGAGFQAAGPSQDELQQQYQQGQANLGQAASGYSNLATNGSQLAQQQLAAANAQNIAQSAGLVSSQKGLNPALATRMAGQQAAYSGNQAANQSAQLQAQTQMMGLQGLAGAGLNQAGLASQTLGNQNQVNAGIASGNQANQAKIFGGALNGGATALAAAHGGMIPHFDDGGMALPDASANASSPPGTPQSGVGKFFQGFSQSLSAPGAVKAAGSMDNSPIKSPQENMQKMAPMAAMMFKGGNVHNLKTGGHVPGKAKVKGDSYSNDTVKAQLSPGEVVIPRSVMGSKDPASGAAQFVAAILAKQGGMRK